MILQTVIVIILMKVQNQTGETNIYMYVMKYHPRTTKTQVFSLSVLNFYCAFMDMHFIVHLWMPFVYLMLFLGK